MTAGRDRNNVSGQLVVDIGGGSPMGTQPWASTWSSPWCRCWEVVVVGLVDVDLLVVGVVCVVEVFVVGVGCSVVGANPPEQ